MAEPQQEVFSFEGVRLQEFEVQGLFGEFDYRIPLRLNEHVTAIIAPNGTGKTLCLRMIAGLFEHRWSVFYDTDFGRAGYTFSDGTVVTIEKRPIPADRDEGDVDASVHIRILPARGEKADWSPRFSDPKRAIHLDRYLPFLTRVAGDKWRHDHSGEILGLPEIVEAYGESLPGGIRTKMYGKVPEALLALTREIDCRLIETQRLLILKDEQREVYYGPPRKARSTLAITQKAQTLKEIISKEINAYAALSQSLDRSFPKRVIANTTLLSAEGLGDQLDELDTKRRELMEAGILDTETDDPVELPEGPLENAIARVLQVYADDTKQKLSSLSPLLAKIKLFKELIDQRFTTKDVTISKQNGIDVFFKGNIVPLDKLSSGEQHQLVLFFELLFEIKKNSLILIDEPELSLHVAWQKKFIGDLINIIKLNKFDVVLATHSPQLIGRWNDLVVELGDVYEGEYSEEEDGEK
ncbi:AAA family ATPase [Mesorhizobium sp. M0491]|uniref:AAA family ATPase n=1 Tax=Mesorhizobium sp. M0491 TaxID=2956950 RepID=UPI00333A18EB